VQYIKILILILLLIILIQDIKSRSVYWFVFPILVLLLLILRYQTHHNLIEIWQPALINIGFLVLQILLVSAYFSIRNKQLINITGQLLGLGDILFLLTITVYLSVLNFLGFYIMSLVIVLFSWLIWQLFSAKKNYAIPLAGLQALILIAVLSFDWWVKNLNLTDDTWLLNLITK
jgi:hypothetical protein